MMNVEKEEGRRLSRKVHKCVKLLKKNLMNKKNEITALEKLSKISQ